MPSLLLTGAGPSGGSAGFSPAQLTGLSGWWDATQITPVADGTALSQWNDVSGNARHFTQATGALQPLYKTAIQNSKPIVRFDGTDDLMDCTALFGNAVGLALAVFGVICDRNPVTNHDFLGCRGQGWFMRVQTNTFLYTHTGYTGQQTQTGISLTGFHQFGATRAAQSGGTNATELYWDGTQWGTPGAITGYDVSATPTRLGAGPASGASNWSPIDVGELLILDNVPNSTVRGQIETYLRTKWGTP